MPSVVPPPIDSGGPRYIAVAESLLERRRGLSRPLKLESEQRLASNYNVARDTLRRAMGLLERRGAVIRERGRGTYLMPLSTQPKSAKGAAIGIILPWWVESVREWYVAATFNGIAHWADCQGSHLSMFSFPRICRDVRKLMTKVTDRNLKGLLWIHPVPEQMSLLTAAARQVPCVIIGREYPGHNLHSICPDYHQAAALIDQQLHARGHCRYAVLGKSPADPYGALWLQGFEAAQVARGAHFDLHSYIDVTPFQRDLLADLLIDHYLGNNDEVTAIVATSSSYLAALLASERFRDLAADRLSLVAFDYGIQPMEAYWPNHKIAHVTCDWKEIGRWATDTLFSLLEYDTAPDVIRDPVRFVAGDSLHDLAETENAA